MHSYEIQYRQKQNPLSESSDVLAHAPKSNEMVLGLSEADAKMKFLQTHPDCIIESAKMYLAG